VTEMPATATTWLMARTEGSAHLWQTDPRGMAAALPYFRATITHVVALHGGALSTKRPACDGFTAAFDRAADAVSCALYLQLTPLDPFELCIGVHSTAAGTERLRDIAHGGQTLISGTAASLVEGDLPSGATLKYLGDQRMDGGEPQERLLQLCHPGLPKYLRPLRMPNAVLAEVLVN
jgi:class 3 adenylate cyclase